MGAAGMEASRSPSGIAVDIITILNTVPHPLLVLNGVDDISYASPSAELFFSTSATQLCCSQLSDLIPHGRPEMSLVREARKNSAVISEYGIELASPRLGSRLVDATASSIVEAPENILLILKEYNNASKMDRQLIHRSAARSVTGMAALLAHEVKNPLSGIRGAAQLLEQNANSEEKVLTRLICDETDRIVRIVERMEMFSDNTTEHQPVNIHRVLERVRQVAQNGFAKNIHFTEIYDPSLPSVQGNFDQLVQVLLNLVKNSAEAAPTKDGIITLSTAFRHGLRMAVSGSQSRLNLPIEIVVQDNGSGVADDIKPFLFEAFVTNKTKGSGLGLALVAKLVDDHGGIVECADVSKGAQFRIMLPMNNNLQNE